MSRPAGPVGDRDRRGDSCDGGWRGGQCERGRATGLAARTRTQETGRSRPCHVRRPSTSVKWGARRAAGGVWLCTLRRLVFFALYFAALIGSSRLLAPYHNKSSFSRLKMNALATKSFNGQALAASSRRTTASARSALVVRAGRIVRRISIHSNHSAIVIAHSALHPPRQRECRPVAFLP